MTGFVLDWAHPAGQPHWGEAARLFHSYGLDLLVRLVPPDVVTYWRHRDQFDLYLRLYEMRDRLGGARFGAFVRAGVQARLLAGQPVGRACRVDVVDLPAGTCPEDWFCATIRALAPVDLRIVSG